ncbi:hypothetical protein D3C72_1123140 [compost metagenome]
MQGVAQPLQAMNEDRNRANIEQWLQRTADVDGEQEHHIHHQQEDRQTEETVQNDFIHRCGETARLGGQGIADHFANGRDTLIARIGDMQRRIVQLVAQACQRHLQALCGVASVAPAIDIAFQHL